MSELILPKRGSMSATEMKLVTAAIMAASYARMLQLGIQHNLEPYEERDLKRLMQWWNNLGEEQKQKIEEWIITFSRDTEDVTGMAGRQAVKKVSEWNTTQ
jgi:hypothetical protein